MRGAAPLFGCALACALLAACSRDDDKPKEITLAPGYTRAAFPDAGPRVANTAKKDEPWPGDIDSSAPRPFQIILSRTVVHEAGAPPVNPDDAILERARTAAAACFNSSPPPAGYAPPERSAHIVFTVIPTGTVSSADVSSGESDENLLGCLRRQALSTTFSDNTGGPLRSYAIDVRVFAKGNGVGR